MAFKFNLPGSVRVSNDAPVDDRIVVANDTARDQLVTDERVYEGMTIWHVADSKKYTLTTLVVGTPGSCVWTENPLVASGITDAPNNGQPYVRQSLGWVDGTTLFAPLSGGSNYWKIDGTTTTNSAVTIDISTGADLTFAGDAGSTSAISFGSANTNRLNQFDVWSDSVRFRSGSGVSPTEELLIDGAGTGVTVYTRLNLDYSPTAGSFTGDSFLLRDATGEVRQVAPTGTPGSLTYLRGDGAWVDPVTGQYIATTGTSTLTGNVTVSGVAGTYNVDFNSLNDFDVSVDNDASILSTNIGLHGLSMTSGSALLFSDTDASIGNVAGTYKLIATSTGLFVRGIDLQYEIDQSGSYTNRSLVDKEYVDTVVIGASDGWSKSGTTTLNGAATIESVNDLHDLTFHMTTAGGVLRLLNDAGSTQNDFSFQDDRLYMEVTADDTYTSGAYSFFKLQNAVNQGSFSLLALEQSGTGWWADIDAFGNATNSQVRMRAYQNGETILAGIDIDTDDTDVMRITDTIANVGLVYAAEMTSGPAKGARWIPDKGYNDATYAPISGGGNYWGTSGTTNLTGATTIDAGATHSLTFTASGIANPIRIENTNQTTGAFVQVDEDRVTMEHDNGANYSYFQAIGSTARMEAHTATVDNYITASSSDITINHLTATGETIWYLQNGVHRIVGYTTDDSQTQGFDLEFDVPNNNYILFDGLTYPSNLNVQTSVGNPTYDFIAANVQDDTRTSSGEANFLRFQNDGTDVFKVNVDGTVTGQVITTDGTTQTFSANKEIRVQRATGGFVLANNTGTNDEETLYINSGVIGLSSTGVSSATHLGQVTVTPAEGTLGQLGTGVYLRYRGNSANEMLFHINSAGMLVQDARNSTGLQYAADYSAAGSLLDRWIPDKGYTDGAYWKASGTTNIVTSAIIQGTGAEYINMLVDDSGGTGDTMEFMLRDDETYIEGFADTTERVYFSVKTSTTPNITLRVEDGLSIPAQIVVDPLAANVITITDSINSKGMVYAADYSANFTDRSLADWGNVWKVDNTTDLTAATTVRYGTDIQLVIAEEQMTLYSAVETTYLRINSTTPPTGSEPGAIQVYKPHSSGVGGANAHTEYAFLVTGHDSFGGSGLVADWGMGMLIKQMSPVGIDRHMAEVSSHFITTSNQETKLVLSVADNTGAVFNVAEFDYQQTVFGNYTFDTDQTVGVGQDNYVLTYDNGSGLISLEAAAGGGAFTADGQTQITPSTNPLLDEATGNEIALSIPWTADKATSGNVTGLQMNLTDTATPGQIIHFDFKRNSTSVLAMGGSGDQTSPNLYSLSGNDWYFRMGGATVTTYWRMGTTSIEWRDNNNSRLLTNTDTTFATGDGHSITLGQLNASTAVRQKILNVTADVNHTVGGGTPLGYTGIHLDVTETQTQGTANYLMDLQVGSSSKFTVDNAGSIYIPSNSALELGGIGGNDSVYSDGVSIFLEAAGAIVAQIGGFGADITANQAITSTTNLHSLTGGSLEASGANRNTVLAITSTVNQSASALGYTGILLDVTETATVGTANYLMDLQVDGTSLFNVDNTGATYVTDVLTVAGVSANAGRLRLAEDLDNGTSYVTILAPAVLGGNVTVQIPTFAGARDMALTSSAQTFTDKTIDADNNTLSNIHIGNSLEASWNAIGDITDGGGTYATGDKLIIFEAGVGMRKIDWTDLPVGAFTADGNTQITPTTSILLDQATGDEIALDLSFQVNKATSGSYTGINIVVDDDGSPAATNYIMYAAADLGSGANHVFSVEGNGIIRTSADASSANGAIYFFESENTGWAGTSSGTIVGKIGNFNPITFTKEGLKINNSAASQGDTTTDTPAIDITSGEYQATGAIRQHVIKVNPTINQSGATVLGYTGIHMDVTETSTGSASTDYLMDLQVGSISRFSLSNDAVITSRPAGTSYYSGTDDTSVGASFLTDSGETWTTNEWVGYYIYNITDGSSGKITANTGTTITATLSGGTNVWDSGDAYVIRNAASGDINDDVTHEFAGNGDVQLWIRADTANTTGEAFHPSIKFTQDENTGLGTYGTEVIIGLDSTDRFYLQTSNVGDPVVMRAGNTDTVAFYGGYSLYYGAAAPGTPTTGNANIWFDSTDESLKIKDDTGAIFSLDNKGAGTTSTVGGASASATGTDSLAFGANSTATANNASAVGSGADATAAEATAIGYNAQAVASNVTVVGSQAGNTSGSKGTGYTIIGQGAGQGTENIGTDTVIIGRNAQAVEANGIAIGPNAEAQSAAVAIGRLAGDNNGTKDDSFVAIGNQAGYSTTSEGVGLRSVMVGETALVIAAADYGVALGYDATVEGVGGIGIGRQVNPTAQGAIIMGYHTAAMVNDRTDSFALGWDETIPSMWIEKYTGTTTDATANVVIGTIPLDTSSTYHLEVSVVGGETDTSPTEYASYKIYGTFYRNGAGSITRVGSDTADHTAETTAGMDCNLNPNGTTGVEIRVTGVATTNMNWRAVVKLTKVVST